MKTSTLLLIGGAVVAGYYLAKRQADAATSATAGATSLARGEPSAPPTTQVVVMPSDINDNYGPAWGWAAPVWAGRAWRGHGGGGGHHGHGHGHGGHH